MRTSGILLPISSLPGKYGIGCFSKEARDYIDFLKESKQHFWQILPIGPSGFGNSPYQSYSTYAIDPMFIDIEQLLDDGFIEENDCKELEGFSEKEVEYEKIRPIKMKILKKAYKNRTNHTELEDFASREAYWLDGYALFMDIHERNGKGSYTKWSPEFLNPDWSVVDRYKIEYAEDINFHRFVQCIAAKQWKKIKKYANDNGIEIIGDIPIYVSPDSADVWLDRNLFQMTKEGKMDYIAGCPGDPYAPKGQLWGNPLYNWEYHRNTNFAWWKSRMRKAFELYDVVRIDHFRGFDEYFSIPYGDQDASNGIWKPSPGYELFSALKEDLKDRFRVIAEDLGFLTASVHRLREECGFPGMKVLQFAYGSDSTNVYLPHLHVQNSICYTGTHDNQTTLGWLTDKRTPKEVIEHIKEYHGFDRDIKNENMLEQIIKIAFASVADTCIIPIQDYLGLGDEARINTPSTLGGKNWKWRVDKKDISKGLAVRIKGLVELYGR